MYLEKVAIDYLKNISIDRIFKRYFVSENTNKSINVKGNNNEFLEHREYQYSDDLKNINWKIYARTERLYSKVFSTDVTKDVLIMLDVSKSMTAGTRISKLEYSKFLVSIVAYKLVNEGYSIKFATFNETVNSVLSVTLKKFGRLSNVLLNTLPLGKTSFSNALKIASKYINNKSNVLIISDLIFIKPQEISLLRKLFPKKDIVIFQVLSEEEINFLKGEFVEFIEPEGNTKKLVHLSEVSKGYLEKFSSFLEKIYLAAVDNKITLVTFNTSIPYYITLKKNL
ncbi:MAG: DUF58 domain-containing protein [Brevinematales bacterium]|nr:DUF58 domain-containing protein [Brevinematales bacterium]